MTQRKRKRTGVGSYNTANQRALANPRVASVIKVLRRSWRNLDKIERGDQLRYLATQGCSTRGLGKALRKSPTSILRHLELAGLPTKIRDAIKAGASAKKLLARKAIANRTRRLQQRNLDDQKTGRLSNAIADLVLQFCRTTNGIPQTPVLSSDVPVFLGNVRLHLTLLETSGYHSARISNRLAPVSVFEALRPEEIPEGFWMDHQSRWLALIIYSRSPEQPIWERSLEKAEARASELNPKKTLEEVYEEREARRLLIHLPPPRRRY
jgi:hypothetical protein